jgi:hypothetical protein
MGGTWSGWGKPMIEMYSGRQGDDFAWWQGAQEVESIEERERASARWEKKIKGTRDCRKLMVLTALRGSKLYQPKLTEIEVESWKKS